jgi:hypothetical protein
VIQLERTGDVKLKQEQRWYILISNRHCQKKRINKVWLINGALRVNKTIESAKMKQQLIKKTLFRLKKLLCSETRYP